MGSSAIERLATEPIVAKIVSDSPIHWIAPLAIPILMLLSFLLFNRDEAALPDRESRSRSVFLNAIWMILLIGGGSVLEMGYLQPLLLIVPAAFMTSSMLIHMPRYCDACGSNVQQAFGSRSEYRCPRCGSINAGR